MTDNDALYRLAKRTLVGKFITEEEDIVVLNAQKKLIDLRIDELGEAIDDG